MAAIGPRPSVRYGRKWSEAASGHRHRFLRNTRSGRAALQVPARSLLADDGSRVVRYELMRPLKRGHLTADQLAESSWEPVDESTFRAAWQAEVDEALSSLKRERLHLATGLLLPVWDKLPADHVRVSRISARDGRSLLGREVPLHAVGDICSALGLDARPDTAPESLFVAVLASGRAMPVKARETLMLKRSLVNSAERLELTGWSAARLDWYKAQGCFTEIIRFQTRLFIPLEGAADLLARIGGDAG